MENYIYSMERQMHILRNDCFELTDKWKYDLYVLHLRYNFTRK